VPIAARNGKEQTTKLLFIEKGSQFSSMDRFGRTPIIWATNKRQSKIVKLLLEKYKNTSVFICEDDLPNATARACYTKGCVICDICKMSIADTERHYHCDICRFAEFDICQQCASLVA
jgi:ankyrin repeat protein